MSLKVSERPGVSEQTATAVSIDSDSIQQQTARLLADPLFHHSKRYSNLLKFIVDRSLDGHHECLKERIIGIEVFGRKPDYDTSLDPTVRVAATEVRKRLTLYYSDLTHERELRIDVPLRSYLAEFSLPEPRLQPVPASHPIVEESEPLKKPQKRFLRYALSILGLLVILIPAVWGVHRLLFKPPTIDRFWAPVLTVPGATLICIGSTGYAHPGSTELMTPPGLEKSDMSLYEFAKQWVNVSMTDVTIANGLNKFLNTKGKETVLSADRAINLAELGSKPVVLMGSFNNSWVMRLGSNLHFSFRRESEDGVRWIEDSSDPDNKSFSVDLSAPYEKVDKDYALVSRVLDPSTGRWWIGISGLTGLGTRAGYQMLTDPKAMAELGNQLPKDWDRKNLQVVLTVSMVQGSPGASTIVAKYLW